MSFQGLQPLGPVFWLFLVDMSVFCLFLDVFGTFQGLRPGQFLVVVGLNTFSPVVGQIPALASVPATFACAEQVSSIEQHWK